MPKVLLLTFIGKKDVARIDASELIVKYAKSFGGNK
jgi:hypothetical protein